MQYVVYVMPSLCIEMSTFYAVTRKKKEVRVVNPPPHTHTFWLTFTEHVLKHGQKEIRIYVSYEGIRPSLRYVYERAICLQLPL